MSLVQAEQLGLLPVEIPDLENAGVGAAAELCTAFHPKSLLLTEHPLCWPLQRRSLWACAGLHISQHPCCRSSAVWASHVVQHLSNGVDPAGHWRGGSATCTTQAQTGLPPPSQKCWGTSPSCARHHATCWRWVEAALDRCRLETCMLCRDCPSCVTPQRGGGDWIDALGCHQGQYRAPC